MDYFAGLDVSMAETHICIVARTGAVIHKAKVPSTPAGIAIARRVVSFRVPLRGGPSSGNGRLQRM
jgi:hypothetical protein